jgi:hypothetical protein
MKSWRTVAGWNPTTPAGLNVEKANLHVAAMARAAPDRDAMTVELSDWMRDLGIKPV